MKIIMKYNLPILILLLLISTFSLNSQSKQMQAVPPTYWENYMSFKIGNYFEYEYNGGLYRYSRRIVGDTIMQSNGKRYFRIEYISPILSPPSYRYERIDSTGDWYIYFAGTQQQCLLYRLNVPLGTAFWDGCGGVNPVILQDTFSLSSILGNSGPFFVRKYYYQSMTPGDYYIARKFQNYYWYNYEGGNYAHLVGAIIDSVVYGSVSGILNENAEIPSDYKLFQNYPNPFNPLTKIRFSLPNPSSGEGPGVRLVVYNVLGKEVATLVNETLAPGNYEVEWNASNHPSGIYFYRLTAGDYTEAKKMILTK